MAIGKNTRFLPLLEFPLLHLPLSVSLRFPSLFYFFPFAFLIPRLLPRDSGERRRDSGVFAILMNLNHAIVHGFYLDDDESSRMNVSGLIFLFHLRRSSVAYNGPRGRFAYRCTENIEGGCVKNGVCFFC